MARSRKRTPIFGNTCAESDKPFKSAEHRRERRAIRAALNSHQPIPAPKAFGDPWVSPKDGRRYWQEAPDRLMRK